MPYSILMARKRASGDGENTLGRSGPPLHAQVEATAIGGIAARMAAGELRCWGIKTDQANAMPRS